MKRPIALGRRSLALALVASFATRSSGARKRKRRQPCRGGMGSVNACFDYGAGYCFSLDLDLDQENACIDGVFGCCIGTQPTNHGFKTCRVRKKYRARAEACYAFEV